MRSQTLTALLFKYAAMTSVALIAVTATAADKAKKDNYPLKTCIVSGEPLDSAMGAPVVMHYKGRTVKLCCDDCVPKFKKNPEKYLKKLDEAAAKAKGGK